MAGNQAEIIRKLLPPAGKILGLLVDAAVELGFAAFAHGIVNVHEDLVEDLG